MLSTIDTHTAAGPTRIITAGTPRLYGESIKEKMHYFQQHYDNFRQLLMHEPRGHKDMWGAVLAEPSHPDADVGAFFINANGYLPACVHSAIGVATAGLKTGFIEQPSNKGKNKIVMEIPAGLISLTPNYLNDQLQSISLQTAPAFVEQQEVIIPLNCGRNIAICIVFSGVFFALVDMQQLGKNLSTSESIDYLRATALELLDKLNNNIKIVHPENPMANAIAMLMFYEEISENHSRDIVFSTKGNIDRSPCGAGTGARITQLHSQGRLDIKQNYQLESFLGSQFHGEVVGLDQVGQYPATIPQITGSAYITGMHNFVLEQNDPLKKGFIF